MICGLAFQPVKRSNHSMNSLPTCSKAIPFWFIDGVSNKTLCRWLVSMLKLIQQQIPLFCLKILNLTVLMNFKSLVHISKYGWRTVFTRVRLQFQRCVVWIDMNFEWIDMNSFGSIVMKLLFSNNLIWQNKQRNKFFSHLFSNKNLFNAVRI